MGKRRSEANNAFASAAETGATASAVDTLLFSLDPLLHPRRRAGEFAQDFARGHQSLHYDLHPGQAARFAGVDFGTSSTTSEANAGGSNWAVGII